MPLLAGANMARANVISAKSTTTPQCRNGRLFSVHAPISQHCAGITCAQNAVRFRHELISDRLSLHNSFYTHHRVVAFAE